MIRIRTGTGLDRDAVREIHLRAFPEGERQLVATLAVNLLDEETIPGTIALLAEADGAAVGHVAFSPVAVDVGTSWQGYILAPLGVKPGYRGRGIGSQLVGRGMDLLSGLGVDVLFVYGDPGYYGRFGFKAEAAARFLPPYELQYPRGWQAAVLGEERFAGERVRISCVSSLCEQALW